MKSKPDRENKNIDKGNKKTYSYDKEPDISDAFGESSEIVIKLKQKLKNCLVERKEYLDGWQRSKAELINARKQDAEQNERTYLRKQEDFIFQLLPILDSFDLAFTDTKEIEKVDNNWRIGIQNIHSQFKAFLKSVDVDTIEQAGELFDPEKHDSVEIISTTNKKEDGLIVEVLQKGYILKGNIIRPARVRVYEFKV